MRTRSGNCARRPAISRGTGPCTLVVTSPTVAAGCPLIRESYVMVEHATWKGAPRQSLRAGWTPRWGHLPPAIRAVWQSDLHEVPARRTWPRAVLVWLLLGLPAADAQLLHRQAAASWRRTHRRARSSRFGWQSQALRPIALVADRTHRSSLQRVRGSKRM